jgi:diguanylate cyclase (GGDEF)-like protein
MASTLRAIEAHAVALAGDDLDNEVLQSPLPGLTGRALQATLDQLRETMRANEVQRDLLQERATHDSLTNLLNRGAASEALHRDFARARREGVALAVLYIDLDGLKTINDTFGHEGGDAAIRTVAEALRATARRSDIVARFGGDEFVVSCPVAGGEPEAVALAERIRQALTTTVTEVGDNRVDVSCSIGIAVSVPTDLDIEALLRRADQALYAAKSQGGAQVRGTDPAEVKMP